MYGEFLDLHPLHPVEHHLGKCREKACRYEGADASGIKVDDILTSTALLNATFNFQNAVATVTVIQ